MCAHLVKDPTTKLIIMRDRELIKFSLMRQQEDKRGPTVHSSDATVIKRQFCYY